MNPIKLAQVYGEATQLMSKHGLIEQGWKFELDGAKQRVGQCRFNDKTISFSKHYLESSPEQVTDMLLHEIAHALVGPSHGHDDTWRMKCIEIGAKPERLAGEGDSADQLVASKAVRTPNYVIKCPNCDHKWPRHRLRKQMHTARCPYCVDRPLLKVYKVVK